MNEYRNLEYDGYTVYCPICDIGIDIEDGAARCDYCGWEATDSELIDIMVGEGGQSPRTSGAVCAAGCVFLPVIEDGRIHGNACGHEAAPMNLVERVGPLRRFWGKSLHFQSTKM